MAQYNTANGSFVAHNRSIVEATMVVDNHGNPAAALSTDAFNRLRVSNPSYAFDAQFTYDLHPYLFEQIASGNGAITFDATNRCANITFDTANSSAEAIMQSFDYIPYQPGRSQLAFVTFNMEGATANTIKFAGLGDSNNGFMLELPANGTPQFKLYSNTTKGNQTASQNDWNIDKLDGTGRSKITLNLSKIHILCIDFQALYVGRVRFGFDINGDIVWAHEFLHANIDTHPYIAQATLPIRVGMKASGGSVPAASMKFICCSVISEGGNQVGEIYGYAHSYTTIATAGNGAAAHLLALRPMTNFKGITPRAKIVLESVEVYITGNFPVKLDLVMGQALSGSNSFANVNSESTLQYNTTGTLSGNPSITLHSAYIPSSAANKGSASKSVSTKYPITLHANGEVRTNGTLGFIGTGIGGSSTLYITANWVEIR